VTHIKPSAVAEVFAVALRLGLTSFGGPVAHIGYFRTEYVERRRWLDEHAFGELVAVTNLLPGPSSSQLGIAIGALRAGSAGGAAAWLGFTLPSAVAMTALGLGVGRADVSGAGWLHGLALAAAAVVLAAVIALARALTPDLPRLAVAAAAATLALLVAGPLGQTLTILGAGALGAVAFRRLVRPVAFDLRLPFGPRTAVACLVALALLLVGLPVVRDATDSQAAALAAAMTRAGTLVFGGGHVVLPLLDEGVVEPGWVEEDEFLAGYGAAQAVPGPLFTFSAYLGAVESPEPNGVPGAALALVAIFAPSFLLLGGVLPLWSRVRRRMALQAALLGVGAAVVGLLAAALWDPVLTESIDGIGDAAVAGALFVLLRVLPPWAVVAVAALVGMAFF
jgi:chromate transporter